MTGKQDEAGAGAERSQDGDAYSLIDLLNVLLRHYRAVIGLPALFFAVAVVVALTSDPTYTSVSKFSPETARDGTSGLSGVAAQFGVQLGGSLGGSQSIDFYAQLVETDGILREVVTTEFSTEGSAQDLPDSAMTLLEIWEIEGGSEAVRMRRAIDQLARQVSVTGALEAGTVIVRVTAAWPELAVAINGRLVALVNEFNLRTRQSQARAEREFAEERMEAAREELHAAEDTMERFLIANRNYQNSPQLSFEAARLQRQVTFAQQLYSSLAQAYEQARISAVRNTPVITTIEQPENTVRRDRRNLLMKAVLAIMLGLIAGVGYALTADYFRRLKTEAPADYAELRRRAQAIARKLMPGRLADRWFSP